MTIVARRRVYWSLFILASACLVSFFFLYNVFAGIKDEAPDFLVASQAIFYFHLGSLVLPSFRLAAIGLGLCSLFSALALGFILYSFRKTVSSEVFFFAFWVLSVGLEVLRLVIFDLAATGASAYWQAFVAKALLFSRYGGCFSLFVSGLYAAGFRNEKLGSIAAMVLVLALALAVTMPINTGSYAPTLELRPGYEDLNTGFFFIIAIVTVINFLYATRATGEKSYRLIALASAIFMLGYWLLVSRWGPFSLILGFVLLVSGSWLFVSKLHSYYLWQ